MVWFAIERCLQFAESEGHADLQVLYRYLAQTTEDMAKAHRIGSSEDRGLLRIMSDEIQSIPPLKHKLGIDFQE